MIRSFIAVSLPEEVKALLEELVKELRPLFPKVSWVKAQNMLLALTFLGNIHEAQIGMIKEIMAASCAGLSAFSLKGHALGVFPHIKRARVIWTGLKGDIPILEKLQADIETGLSKKGFKREDRPSHPHLTLGRIKTPVNAKRLLEVIERYKEFSTPDFTVKEVILFKSELHPQGARYSVLERVKIANQG